MKTIKRIIHTLFTKLAGAFGYDIRFFKKGDLSGDNFVLYSYTNKEGEFDYEAYKDIQTQRNKAKLDYVFADEQTIELIAQYLQDDFKNNGLSVQKGLCHGTRAGKEQQWFSKALNAEVMGTEISETATQFANTVQWDFHEQKEEWVGRHDFVYSNSFDHAFDPEKALNSWVNQISDNGFVFIEHTLWHTEVSVSSHDPFGAQPIVMPYLIAKWGRGRFSVVDILEPEHTKKDSKIWVFVIAKTNKAIENNTSENNTSARSHDAKRNTEDDEYLSEKANRKTG